MAGNMRHRLVQARHDAGRNDRFKIFGVPVIGVGRNGPRIQFHEHIIRPHFAASIQQRRNQGGGGGIVLINQQRLCRPANASAPHLCVDDQGLRHVWVSVLMNIAVADAVQMREHGNTSLVLNAGDQ